MDNLCIIPARGGSKRIPRKNIKDFLGKPIIAYSIEAALQSNLFEEVMVSTDSEEIAEIAKQYGASVPFFRSRENADDYASTNSVILEVIENYRTQKQKSFQVICCLYPCAPLVQHRRLVEAYEILNKSEFTSLVPVVQFSYPIQRALDITPSGIQFVDPSTASKRSQDLDPKYHDCGMFYFATNAHFLKFKQIISGHTAALVLPELEVQDIDSLDDWALAELKYKLIYGIS